MYPRFSPDGSRIVFSTQQDEDDEDNLEVGVSNLDGSEYQTSDVEQG